MSSIKKIIQSPVAKVSRLNPAEPFMADQSSIKKRVAAGKALRKKVTFLEQGTYAPPKHRTNPIEVLQKQAKSRNEALIPIRYERMLQSPFAFYRGGAAIMAQDLANQATTDITVQLCGDMHVSNFGLFGTAEHRWFLASMILMRHYREAGSGTSSDWSPAP